MNTELKQLSYLGAFLVAFALIAVAWMGGINQQSQVVQENNDYSLERLQETFENTLASDPGDEQALFSLTRVYYISGQTEKALAAIDTYKNLYPGNDRIHYVAGLANAYGGNLDVAEEEFLTFIDSGLSSWAGYLDLAWVYFQQADFESAQESLETAVALFGENAWLNTSRGAVALAQGDRERARAHLLTAQVQAETITQDDWTMSYSLNNPADFAKEIVQMKAVIATNLSYANGDAAPGETISAALKAPFANASPLGVTKGLAVSACGDSCSVTQCVSAANICGAIATGTQNSCGGNVCSAATPPNPAGTCTVATANCGNASGFVGCNGGCNITRYPVCLSATNPTGFGEITWIVLDDTGPGGGGGGLGATDIAAKLVVFPALVNPGGQTVVRWASTETVSCTVTGENGDEWIGPVADEQISGFITEETDYLLECLGYDGSTVTDTATVRIVPVWQEF